MNNDQAPRVFVGFDSHEHPIRSGGSVTITVKTIYDGWLSPTRILLSIRMLQSFDIESLSDGEYPVAIGEATPPRGAPDAPDGLTFVSLPKAPPREHPRTYAIKVTNRTDAPRRFVATLEAEPRASGILSDPETMAGSAGAAS